MRHKLAYSATESGYIVFRFSDISLVMRKPAFCICENKDADQLRGNREADFATWILQSLYFLNPKFQARFVSDLVRNPEHRFSQNEAHIETGEIVVSRQQITNLSIRLRLRRLIRTVLVHYCKILIYP